MASLNQVMPSLEPVIEWGVATLTLPGQNESGDLHLVKPFPNGALVAVVDGLGHGQEAASAAKRAVDTFEEHAEEPLISLLQRCHQTLKHTRGAVVSLAQFDAAHDTLTWLGVGNVEGVLVRADPQANPPRETILLLAGVLGFQMPIPRATVMTVTQGDTLVFATDGIRDGFIQELIPDAPQRSAERICAKYCKNTDDALVLVARYLGGRP